MTARKPKQSRFWIVIAVVPSRSRAKLKHRISRHRTSKALWCSCEGFKWSDAPKSCAHVRAPRSWQRRAA